MLVAAAPFTGAGGQDDVLVSPHAGRRPPSPPPRLARSNPGVVTDRRGRLTPVTPPPRHASPGRWAARRAHAAASRPTPGRTRASDDPRACSSPRCVPLALVAMALMGSALGGGPGGLIPDATGTPELAVVPPPTPSPTPSPTLRPTPTVTDRRADAARRPRARPRPHAPRRSPHAAPDAGAHPVAQARPHGGPRSSCRRHARAVERFYGAVEDHDWDLAIALWSPSMQRALPAGRVADRPVPADDRHRHHPPGDALGQPRRGNRPNVAVRLIEYRTRRAVTADASPESWDLVLIDGRWKPRPAALLMRSRARCPRLVRALHERLEPAPWRRRCTGPPRGSSLIASTGPAPT